MNIISNQVSIKLLWLSAALFLWGCFQGPWEYDVSEKKSFLGIHSFSYVIADRPVEDVCFAKTLEITETNTTAFAFYKTANVTISGVDKGKGSVASVLTSKSDNPNCFQSDFIPVKGENYSLEAVFTWDSSGQETKTTITGNTLVPKSFALKPNVSVTTAALNLSVPVSNAADTSVLQLYANTFNSLPAKVQEELTTIYGDELLSLSTQTPEQQQQWIKNNGKQLNKTTDSLLLIYDERGSYQNGDTVVYLTGNRNTMSHYFSVEASDDVGGVLITHRFEDNAIVPTNPFAEIGGFEPTLEDAYFKGRERRLINWPKIENANYRIFDSLGVVNTWLLGGQNTLYFYGMDRDYVDYTDSFIRENTDPTKVKKFNVTGGEGFFVGGIVDSFKVYVKVPPSLLQFSYFESHAAWCADANWNNKDCRAFVKTYCEEVFYDDEEKAKEKYKGMKSGGYNDCQTELFLKALEEGQEPDALKAIAKLGGLVVLKESSISSKLDLTAKSVDMAQKKYCIENDFSEDWCSSFKEACEFGTLKSILLNETGKEFCQEDQWNYCIDTNWKDASCEWALVSYCKQSTVTSSVLCTPAENYCKTNPKHQVCL